MLSATWCAIGPVLVTLGAALFAGVNATSTALYRRGHVTIVTLYLIRSLLVYIVNGLLVFLREGRTPAVGVLLLRTGSEAATSLLWIRSILGATMALGLNLSFMWLTYADAFTAFKGTGTLTTILITRTCLGSGERLSAREVACGAFILLGITFIAQPPSLFGSSGLFGLQELVNTTNTHEPPQQPHDDVPAASLPAWTPHVSAGLTAAVLSGALSACSAALMRVLSQAGGAHDGLAPPSMLLSFLLVTMFMLFGAVALCANASGLAQRAGWEWTRIAPPEGAIDWCLIGLHCAGVLASQLATAAGYATTRAGIAAFLQMTELPWVYVLDVTALGEPTSLLASLGCAIVFVSAVIAASTRADAAPAGAGGARGRKVLT